MEIQHLPVMVNEVLRSFTGLKGVFLDCTVGLGGHAEAILKNVEGSIVVGLDLDEEALAIAEQRLAEYERLGRVYLINSSYVDAPNILKTLKVERVVGILMDLGVSTLQLSKSERGFAFLLDGPLDMRMNRKQPLTAYNIVNEWDEKELSRIIFEYGEEKRFARRIASFIVRNRPIETTEQLVRAVAKALPPEAKRSRKRHFATRVFQAIRIAVNNELENLKIFLAGAPDLLQVGGRITVISFHSLEDRLVKEAFRSDPRFKVLTKKPIVPSLQEVESNPKARSAKMRIAERI